MATKTYSISEIRLNVTTKWQWAEHAILALYAKQTEAEKQMQHTNELNHQGFTAFDAEILTSFAKQIERNQNEDFRLGHKAHCHLSTKQLGIAYKRLGKYAKQLHDIAEANETPKHDTKLEGPASKIEETCEEFNRRWAGHKNEFARLEMIQEQLAFSSGL